ncbi:MAG TPA: signal recognition particle-docking protein FtsY [Thermoplasmata archaeon]|nr:signal recognition particle-docking protein FtsY [Thermoplasmata archaeon]
MWAAIKARLRRSSESEPSGPESTAPVPPPPVARPSTTAAPARSTAPRPGRSTEPSVAPPPVSDDALFGGGFLARKLKEGAIDDVLDDLEIVLLQSDVALPVIERLRRDLVRELAGRKLKHGVEEEEAIRACLERSVRAILGRNTLDLAAAIRAYQPKPYIIMFVGVNGTGKTTTVAKFAGWLRAQGFSSAIAAGDTFRAGAIEQLLTHGERLGVRVIRQQEGSDPAAVAFDAVAHAKAKGIDVVLIDTAGRQHTNENLVEEAKKIRRVAVPTLTLFVGDALSGNDVVEQARLFDKALGIDGLVLTKLDADAKGGAALSTAFVTKKPILFVGVGQGYADLMPFDPDWMVQRLFAEEAAG